MRPAPPHEPNYGIELLYTSGCQAWPEALKHLKTALQAAGITAEPEIIDVETLEQALAHNFFASPTIHINGVDVDPKARHLSRRGLGVGRPYFANGRSLTAPSVELITAALQELYLPTSSS